MPEIGLFPLELVLLPGEHVPLHVFEDRYKELIGECLAESRDFGLVLQDESGLREVGTRASVVAVTKVFDDGRLDVVVEGGERFRILRPTRGRSFATAEVEPLDDEDAGSAPEEAAERLLALLARVAEAAEVEVEPPDPGAGALSYAVASRVEIAPPVKQELLELRSERERAERVRRLLERALAALELQREVRRRAGGNGRVSPRDPPPAG